MYAVIMAGGRGVRFWPMSREKRPKHLLDIFGSRTLIQETIDRILPIIPSDRIFVVTSITHADELTRQLPEIPRENILVEPMGRNTAPCIGLAALTIMKKDPGAIMVVLPADHRIESEEKLRQILLTAADAARNGKTLVTIGIPPTGPVTGYGYLEQGPLKETIAGVSVYHVQSIREKPGAEQTKEFLSRGGFLWNSGMFVWKASAILEAIALWLPDIHQGLMDMDLSLGTPDECSIIEQVYGRMKSISIDYGVMEKADNVAVIPGDFGWSDVGSWDAIWEIASKDGQGNSSPNQARIIAVDSYDNLIQVKDKLIALVDVKDLIIVETDDELLICKRGASQDIRKVVEILENKKMTGYL
jgi:mannose-1-phosphate guanylyltransferase